jgi:hypothetical protein
MLSLKPMRPRLIKLLIILALAVYLCAPLFEMVDRWDDFQQHTGDIALSTSAVITTVGAVVCFALARMRRARFRAVFVAILRVPDLMTAGFGNSLPLRLPTNFHSPPASLRI